MILEIVTLVLCVLMLIAFLSLGAYLLFRRKKDQTPSAPDDTSEKIGRINEKIESMKQNLDSSLDSKITLLGEKMKTALTEQAKSNAQELGDQTQKTLDNQMGFLKSMEQSFNAKVASLSDSFNNKVSDLDARVNKSIGEGFKTSSEQVGKVSESLIKIQKAQDNLVSLDDDISKLRSTLSFSGPMGKFGEKTLGTILRSVYGDTRNIYEEQQVIRDDEKRVIADAVINLPDPLKMLCIDSKFSFASFSALFNSSLKGDEEKSLKAKFKGVLQEEINKISQDYIIPGKTCSYALMFIPNDGIYVYIQSDSDLYTQVIEYAYKKNVVLTSPSTIQPILSNLNLFRISLKQTENIQEIVEEATKIDKALDKWKESWEKFSEEIDSLARKRDELSVKTKTLSRRLSQIAIEDSDDKN